mmetsp:Transcript_3993/g.7420  ORF Transcript_3993/g.7420 Transcript_3993/m.7420 type:complete len:136 (-) Transcript_3993:835-1242(-)
MPMELHHRHAKASSSKRMDHPSTAKNEKRNSSDPELNTGSSVADPNGSLMYAPQQGSQLAQLQQDVDENAMLVSHLYHGDNPKTAQAICDGISLLKKQSSCVSTFYDSIRSGNSSLSRSSIQQVSEGCVLIVESQ